MALFTEIAQALTTKGARIHIEMVALGDDLFQAALTPDLGPCPENASVEEANLRALLGSPLTIRGTAASMDEALAEQIAKRMVAQKMGINALSDLQERMSKAANAAAQAKPKENKASAAPKSEKTKPKATLSEEKVERNDGIPEGPLDWENF